MLLETRVIERAGLSISSPGFGCWGISSGFGGSLSPQEIHRVLDAAWRRGVTFFDTAPVYGAGTGESMLGDMSWRHEAVIASKISLARRPSFPVGQIQDYFSPQFMIKSVDQSLRRLRRDHIDVIQLHTWFEDWEGNADPVFDVLLKLKDSGKVRAIGVSLPGQERQSIQGLLKWGVLDTIQIPYNLVDPWAKPLIAEAAACRVAVIARSPLYHGLLAGDLTRFDQMVEGDPRKAKINSAQLARIRQQRQEFAERLRLEANQLASCAIAFVHHTPGVTSVIVGMRTIAQVRDNLA